LKYLQIAMSGNSSVHIPRLRWYSLGLPLAFQITVWISIIIVFVISFLDLAGWVFNITLFKSIESQWTPMKIVTALCFIFAAIALVIILVKLPPILRKIIPRVFATFICLISLITLYVYLYSIRTGQESSLTGVSYLGFFLPSAMRMAFFTACNFLLIGCILFLLPAHKTKASGIAHVLIIPVTLVSYFITVSYILGVYSANELNELSVALNSSIAFCGLCASVLLMRPDTWLLKVFTSSHTGGIIARKLLPPLMTLPVVIGWMRINGERAGLFKSEEGVVLVASTYTVCFLVLVWLTARSINKIDQKRQASEEALRESEDRFRTIAESLPVQISISRASDATILFTNEAYDKTFGFKKGELTRRKAPDYFFNSDDLKNLGVTLKDKGAVNNTEIRVKRSDGSPIWIIASIQTIIFGNEPAYLTASIDISESKKAQDELVQLNRTLNSLSKSSQAMMHSGNELKYLKEVCKIIIEDCGHTLVWIGYAQNDTNKSVKPVAYYGFDEGYIKKLKITWDDSERGRGPTGIAIRTGKPALCLNMQTDPAFEPWRDEAIKRGYASSIVLPLISEGKPFGAISIYSKEPDAFSHKEINLLSDLADDLAYGISYIRLSESERTAAKTIKESEEKYRLLFEGMIEGFALHEIILDEKRIPCDYRFLSINPAFERQTGLKAENIIGKKVSEVLPATEKFWIDTYGKVALTGESIDFENYLSELNSYFRVSAFSPKKGYFAVIFENITKRILAEKELQNTKNYLENLINYANAPIIVWNPDTKIQLFNHAFEHLTGYSSAEVEGKKLDLLFPKTSLKESNAKIKHALTRNWETIEIPILTKDKEIRTVLWNSANIYDNDNKTILSTIAQGNDISERIKAEQEVRKSKEKLDLTLENAKIGIWEWDIRTDEFEWDERIEKMFGLKPDSVQRKFDAFERCIYEEDIPHFRRAIHNTLEKDTPFDTIFRIRLREDEFNYIDAKALVEKDNNGKPIKMTGVCFDITDMKRGAEQALFRLNEDLLRSNKELEQFAYVASHDLQEPLRMVSSFTQLLSIRYKDKLDQEAQEFIKFAVDGALRMQSLINDLLEYSRVETRGKNLSLTDMHDVLGHTINNLSLKIKEKNALVTCDELPTIVADGGQMIQLFQNLIGNALKFCKTSPRVQISAKEEKDHYLFSVKDNGIGIEPQYFDRIFQIFQRLHSKEKYGGTGIGLAICRRIVERHGGKIWVESQPGEGTIFKFTIRKR
jgi:PAS domain S-box-containing protein